MADDKEKQKEEKKKKEYETLKIKRSGLEKIRDVFAVVRDFLFILVLLGLIVVILLGITLLMNAGQILSSVQSGGLGSLLGGSGPLAALGGLGSGNLESMMSGSQVKTVTGDATMCRLLSEAQSAFLNGDTQTSVQKLTQLKSSFNKKAWTDQVQLTDKLITAVNSDDFGQIAVLYSQLENSVQCQ